MSSAKDVRELALDPRVNEFPEELLPIVVSIDPVRAAAVGPGKREIPVGGNNNGAADRIRQGSQIRDR